MLWNIEDIEDIEDIDDIDDIEVYMVYLVFMLSSNENQKISLEEYDGWRQSMWRKKGDSQFRSSDAHCGCCNAGRPEQTSRRPMETPQV